MESSLRKDLTVLGSMPRKLSNTQTSSSCRVIMEIPLELMLTIRQKLPWMFFPVIVRFGHPIFDIISSTNPEKDWDLRLACLLLYAFDRDDNFWQLYGDFLPSALACFLLLRMTSHGCRILVLLQQ